AAGLLAAATAATAGSRERQYSDQQQHEQRTPPAALLAPRSASGRASGGTLPRRRHTLVLSIACGIRSAIAGSAEWMPRHANRSSGRVRRFIDKRRVMEFRTLSR